MWFRALFRRAEVEQDLDDELRFHLERETEKYIRQGMTPEDAEREARRVFGGVERIKDDTRDVRRTAWIDAAMYDLRYTLRGVRRRPGFATAVVVTLGLGLGANVAMFGIVDRLLFRAPAYMHDPARVHRVYVTDHFGAEDFIGSGIAYIEYRDIASTTTSFAVSAAFATEEVAIGRGDETKVMHVGTVSASYFDLFDARPVIGRFFTPHEDSAGAETPVVVLSWGLWQTRYGGRSGVIGDAVQVGSQTYTIVGVAPPGFTGIGGEPVAAFIPVTAYAAAAGVLPHPSDYYADRHHVWRWLNMLVRRRPGVTIAAATADLTHAYRASYEAQRAVRTSMPTVTADHARAEAASVLIERGPRATSVSRVALWTSGVALAVLFIACANVTNLLLLRGLERRREHALRLALGVSRARLIGHVAVEVVLFAAAATVLGVGVGAAGTRLLGAVLLPGVGDAPVISDARTLGFSGLVAFIAAAFTMMTPAIQAGRGTLASMVKDGSQAASARDSRLRGSLLFLQGTLSVVLLIGAGLFVRSLVNARGLRLGYDVDPVLYVPFDARGVALKDVQRASLLDRLLEAARSTPGVTNAALGLTVPFYTSLSTDLFRANRDSVVRSGRFTMQVGSPEYFRTVGTRVIRGRAFTDADRAGSVPVMVVSEPMAQVLWPGQNAIGQCLRMDADTMPCVTVVGVAEGIKQSSLSADSGLQYYLPASQSQLGDASLFVRTAGPATQEAEIVRRRLQRLMPGASFVTVTPMKDIIDPQLRSWQLGATMFVGLGGLALILAAIGLYSVIAFGVTQRTRELGVRVALGARTADVLWLVLRDGVRFTAIGLALGSAMALAAGRWVEPLLFAERSADPLVFGAVTGVLLLAVVAASILPVYRASRVDPNVALRAD